MKVEIDWRLTPVLAPAEMPRGISTTIVEPG